MTLPPTGWASVDTPDRPVDALLDCFIGNYSAASTKLSSENECVAEMAENNRKCHPLYCVNPCRERSLKEERYSMYLFNT